MRPRQSTWSGQQRGGWLGPWIFGRLLNLVGRDAAGRLLGPISAYFMLTAPRARKASAQFNQACSRYWPGSGRPSTFHHFLTFAQVLLDKAAMQSGLGGSFTFSFSGEEFIQRAWLQGKGLLLVSAHLGNWESAGAALQARLPDARVRVARFEAQAGKTSDTAINLSGTDSALEILAGLRRGEIVAMHGDRFLDGARTQALDFLGHPARFPEGPFQLAALAGCPIITCFNLRQGPRHYRFSAYPAETLPQAKPHRTVAVGQALRQYVRRLEAEVRTEPLQWFNFYDFWS